MLQSSGYGVRVLMGGLFSFVDAPLREPAEAYEIKVYSGSVVKPTWRPATTSVLYTSAEQLADFGTAPAILQLEVAQISALVGPGKVAQMSVTVA